MHENQDAQSSQRISIVYFGYDPLRHSVLAAVRCSRIIVAAGLGVIDYKITFAKKYASDEEHLRAVSDCHRRSAGHVLQALLANGGIFIKLGQHLAAVAVLPLEWTSAMRPLQDKCEPTPYEEVEALFRKDMGAPVSELFDEFDPVPIGVASLAQVHVGRDRKTGRRVAVKIQHPHLAEFCEIDMAVFEFTWLADEMRTNLPLEMNFVHEAANAERTKEDFKSTRTTLYIPEVLSATRRVLVMEFIEGGRVDDLRYLEKWDINRNRVALELAAIFNQMTLLNGWFHAIAAQFRDCALGSRPIFDLDPELRVNYSKLWLSLISPASPTTIADRRKYALLVGNIGRIWFYPVFEAALTGRANLEGSHTAGAAEHPETFKRGSGLIDLKRQSEEEKEAIRDAVVQNGILLSVLDVLRRVPRRVLMIFKLNDLTRSLDHALMTTHSNIRIFLISAKYCATAVWQDEQRRLIDEMQGMGFLSLGAPAPIFPLLVVS
ncbi:ABC1-domain-containing protein [Roridomyces roridus]|uniref:ABC1-domain-containing protein n=1 Tax=Roridomyces roridus TaxID=1738132 RepID=A0AAD7CF65_9AGAR|nr:ABC1-domain-containing protein [Roridomyces roridus]